MKKKEFSNTNSEGKGYFMKQLIIMISTIVLGIFIAGIVLQFKDDAGELGKNTNDSLSSIAQELKVTE